MTTGLIYLSRLLAPGAPRGGRIADARGSLDYWSRRAAELPWHRRAARREARGAIATARANLIGAHLAGWGLGSIEPRVTPLLDTGGRSGGAHVRSLALAGARRTAIGRRILAAAAVVTAVSLCVAALAVAVVTHAITIF